jgi:hypothetical protein
VWTVTLTWLQLVLLLIMRVMTGAQETSAKGYMVEEGESWRRKEPAPLPFCHPLVHMGWKLEPGSCKWKAVH